MLGVVLLAEPSATAITEPNRYKLATFDVATRLHKLGEAWDFDR